VYGTGRRPSVELFVKLVVAELRSLDAIHLATVRSAGRRLKAIVTYDARCPRTAGQAGRTRGQSPSQEKVVCAQVLGDVMLTPL
jgi:hypothetical protein